MSDLDRLAATPYVLLTTYTRTGTPKPTAVWVARVDDELVVWTAPDAWKVKRVRNTPRVTVQECSRTGKPGTDTPVEGTARLLDPAGRDRALAAVKAKYGILGRLAVLGARIRRGRDGAAAIAVSLAERG